MKSKIYFFRSNNIAPEPRLTKAAGWLLHSTHLECEITAYAWDREGRSKKEENIDGLQIKRFYASGEYGKGIRKNFFGLLLFNFYIFIQCLFHQVKVVHACDLDTVLPVILVSKIKKINVVYDIYDFYSDTHQLGRINTFIKKVEQWVITQVDVVIIADERRIAQLGCVDQSILDKIIVIYNTPDDIAFETDLQETDDLVISYVGVLSKDRNLLETIKAVQNLTAVQFVLAGYGILSDEIKKYESDTIQYVGRVSYEKALQIEKNSDIILAMYDPTILNNQYAAPNKLCEGMMLGRPIITSNGTLCADVVKSEEIGFVVSYGNVKEMEFLLKKLVLNRRQLKVMGRKSRILYESKYSAKKMSEKLQEVYLKILQ